MKNKILFSLALCSLCSGAIFAKNYTNKTFMTPRPQLTNMAMEYTTWHTKIDKLKKFQPAFQVTGFYQSSQNKRNVGEYFGYYAKYAQEVRDYISMIDTDDTAVKSHPDSIKSNFIFLSSDNDAKGDIQFKPSQDAYGLRIDYYQSLRRFFFQAALPIVDIKNKMNTSNIGVPEAFTGTENNDPRTGKTLADYLRGDVDSATGTIATFTEKQQALTHAKIDSSRSKSGVADIDLALGYNVLKSKHNRIGLKIDLTIPTGNDAKGEYIFEPICGNGKHWALGGGFLSTFRLWENKNDSIELLVNTDLRYLFKNTQRRTFSLKTDEGNRINFGQYYLGGKVGEHALFPLANVLTPNIYVSPGLVFEAIAALAFNTKNFTLDVGYNIFAKNGEKISLKDSWEKETYAIAKAGFDTKEAAATFATTDFQSGIGIDDTLKVSNLDFDALRTPSQITHKIYGGLGYTFNECKYPVLLGLGSSFEFVNGNTALENWAIWGKLGISF